jgi:hypothetical protein
VALQLTPKTLELLKKAAAGRDVEEFILGLLTERLDPPQRVEAYLALHEKYLREAEELYARGDLAQAGEKYWGAVAALLNAIAEKRGWEHYSHRDYNVVVGRLYKESGDKELLTAFGMAERLHANFHHNFMDKEIFEAHREEVLKLVEKLKRYAS